MGLSIGSDAPDFQAETSEGPISFHDWIGDGWAVLCSHPKDFTSTRTTEPGHMAKVKPEFDKRGGKILGLRSIRPCSTGKPGPPTSRRRRARRPTTRIIGDLDQQGGEGLRMLPAERGGDAATALRQTNQTVRNVFVVGPDKKIKLIRSPDVDRPQNLG